LYKEADEQNHQAHQGDIPIKIGCQARADTTEYLVLCVAIQTLDGLLFFALNGFFLLACQFFQLAHLCDDFFHIAHGDDLLAVVQTFTEEFGNAQFNVVDDFFASLLFLEMSAKVVQIFVEQFVGIVVYVIDKSS